ncbi:hypothetical protein AUK40_03140 [Candidatus Wirthbacteria bacterium CG2_30_54_11]|uniref:Glycosyltransferase 2-like domain-containing protein n=1 Tax=Candidatus Wirthbacteria bacterium CG2_30_54_11 TaxID=1817892 RepID=A0A1J5J1W0_9BACT|nr:MAG: hypothetical protein AUK40_03140 [Candidatus Wirthbacteria bacterium CG2_30_54_11]
MLSLIIPTYNESETLAALLRQIFEVTGTHHIHTEVIVVDDNSPDGSGELAYYLKRFFPHLTTFHRDRRLGKTSALVEGIHHAKGNIIGVMDADLTHSPSLIPSLIMPLISGNIDITVASRYSVGACIEGWGLLRRIAHLLATLACRPLTPISDPLSGFFFLRKSVIARYPLTTPQHLLLDLLVHAPYSSVQELPFTFKGRGRSPFGSGRGIDQVISLYQDKLFHHS